MTKTPGKYIIGLTGNIATGKSTVMQMAAEHGALTIDADKVVHGVLANDADAKAAIREVFGDDVFDESGGVIRPNLGRIVFGDPAALKQLEDIVVPATRRAITEQIAATDATIIMLEAIKLLEGGLAAGCDTIWVTFCSAYRQIERLKQFRNMHEDDARQRVEAQAPQEEKIAQADVVIDTNESLTATRVQFDSAWKAVLQEIGD